MSLDEKNPDPKRHSVPASGRKPSFGKSLTILVIFGAIIVFVAIFVSNRSDPQRENDPKTTAPTAGRPSQP